MHNNLNNTPLINAVIEEDIDQVTKLLESRVTVDKMNNDGTTALMEASFNGNLDIVKLLLSYNADPNLVDKNGCSSFNWAYETKNFNVLRELLIKIRVWSSDKDFNKKIWKETLQNFKNYRTYICHNSIYNPYFSNNSINKQQIKKNEGIVKYDSKMYELGSYSEALKYSFDNTGYYKLTHDSSNWVKKKKAQQIYNSKKNVLGLDYGDKYVLSPFFRQDKECKICDYCHERVNIIDCGKPIKENKAWNDIRHIGSPTKRFNNITDYDYE
jgi:hypothetical protein